MDVIHRTLHGLAGLQVAIVAEVSGFFSQHPQPEGVEKLPRFFNRTILISRERRPGGVGKLGGFFNKQDELEMCAARLRGEAGER